MEKEEKEWMIETGEGLLSCPEKYNVNYKFYLWAVFFFFPI